VVRNVAYVLISHGATGLGGWLPSGTQMSLPIATTGDYPNTQTPSYYPTQTPAEFVKEAASDPSVADTTAGFYDDVVAYLKIDDLAHLARLDARDWPEALRTATDIQDFNITTTSNLTNTGTTDHFLTTTVNASPSSAKEFQSTTSSGGVAGAGVTFGSGGGTYSAALWWPNQLAVYSPPTATAKAASGAPGVISFTTAANHNLATGDTVIVTDASPSSYNGTYTVTLTSTPTTFTVATPTVSAASWSSNVITFTTATSHNLTTGNTVIVAGASPSGYNGTYTVASTPTSTTFTVANAVNPGTWVSGGTVNPGSWVSGGTIKRVSTLTGKILTLTTGTSWSSAGGGVTTYVTATSHNLVVGDVITVKDATPSGYNGTYTVTATPDPYTFKVAQANDPGVWVSGGTFTSGRLWSGGVITFNTTANHNYSVGTVVVVSGATPASYNGTYTVTGTPSSTTFTVDQAVDPGNWVSGGTVTPGFRRTLIVSVEAAFNSSTWYSDAGGGLVLGFLPTDGYWVNASSPAAISLNPTLAISGASASYSWWSSTSTITFTTSGQFPFVTGNTVTVSGMSNSNYNRTYTVTDVPTATSFTATMYGWPGSSSSGGTVTGMIAGSNSSQSGIGWDDSGDGNLPAPRFGVEMDMQYSSYRNDPYNENHVAVDGSGVTHGSTAPLCSSSSNTYTAGCYTGSSSSWLMDGLTKFHKVRVEIEPMSPSCGSTAPLLKYWLLPYSVCSSLNTVATGTAWSSGFITFQTSASHGLAVGNVVTVAGASPSGYNGSYTVTAVPSSTTFTVVNPADPGAWVSGGTVAKVSTLATGTSWSGSVITFVTTKSHGFVTGNAVTVTGASPSGYNGTFTITSTPTSTKFTAASSTNPGTWSSGGAVATAQDCTDIEDASTLYSPQSFPSGGVYLAQCIATPNPTDAFNNLYFGFTSNNNNNSSSNSTSNFVLQNLNSSLISVP